jgi:hypothetical protein
VAQGAQEGIEMNRIRQGDHDDLGPDGLRLVIVSDELLPIRQVGNRIEPRVWQGGSILHYKAFKRAQGGNLF